MSDEPISGEIVPAGAPIGRPSSFTQAIADEICRRIAEDESLRSICLDDHLPDRVTVYRWRRENEEFRDQYTRAREDQGHTAADNIGDVRQMLIDGEIEHQEARVLIDALKWESSRRAPKDFGDRIDHTSSDGSMTPRGLADFYGDDKPEK